MSTFARWCCNPWSARCRGRLYAPHAPPPFMTEARSLPHGCLPPRGIPRPVGPWGAGYLGGVGRRLSPSSGAQGGAGAGPRIGRGHRPVQLGCGPGSGGAGASGTTFLMCVLPGPRPGLGSRGTVELGLMPHAGRCLVWKRRARICVKIGRLPGFWPPAFIAFWNGHSTRGPMLRAVARDLLKDTCYVGTRGPFYLKVACRGSRAPNRPISLRGINPNSTVYLRGSAHTPEQQKMAETP
mmetsp:Transcript_130643/g.225948  ORF Transcript_130643/g.225948 Transcript_130643/m.225948 type:complete len:239 (+) Transcript_130643:2711-3427(+)